MEAPKIIRISLLNLPFISKDTFEVMINISKFDKTKHRIIVQIENKVYEFEGNSKFVKIPIKTNNNPLFAGLQPSHDIRIKGFIYNFIDDKIVESKLQEFGYNPLIATFFPNDHLLSTVPIIMGGWKKDKKVIKVEGPFDAEGKIVTVVKQGEPYVFKATPNQSMLSMELLTIKWALKYDDKEKQNFKFQTEKAIGNQNIITAVFAKGIDVKNVTVYAYFLSSSDKVSVKVDIEKVEGDSVGENIVVAEYKWAHSEFGNIIAEKESRNNYNICNKTKGGYSVVKNVIVVNEKIKDIQKKQKNRDLFAVGRYQLIPITLNSAISTLNLDIEKNLDEAMQDKIFDEYLIDSKRPKIIKFLEGDGSVENAMYAAAMEWASIGVEKGKKLNSGKIADGGESYYAGDGLNKAHITPDQIKKSLINSKNENNKK